ncbi:uncharacterized protein LOC143481978 [Brachyhypopomus gauderio]|uniref:uncharacterized protein LOC143481978 n=1 Tax=Brachyhypopomus gauderio TaxID=698409 RepID=UPI00404379A9
MVSHASITKTTEKLVLDGQCSICSLYHCPLCASKVFKPSDCITATRHIESHKGRCVYHGEFTIYKCHLTCRKSPHFHCYCCGQTIIRKICYMKHLTSCSPCYVKMSKISSEEQVSPPETPGSTCAPLPGTPIGSSAPLPGTPIGPSAPLPGTPIGPSAPLPGTPIGPSAPLPGTPIGPSAPLPVTPIGPSAPLPGTPIGPSAPLPGTPIGPSAPLPVTPIGPSAPLPGTPIGPSAPLPGTQRSPSAPLPWTLKSPFTSPPGEPRRPFVPPPASATAKEIPTDLHVDPSKQLMFLPSKNTQPILKSQSIRNKIQCPHCNISLYSQNFKKHLKRKHGTMVKDITADTCLRSQCIDPERGIFAVTKTFHGPPVPIHVAQKLWGSDLQNACEVDECNVNIEVAVRSGCKTFRCCHQRSLDYCCLQETMENLKDEILTEMVSAKWFGEAKKLQCLQKKKEAAQEQAPLAVSVNMGSSTKHYVSVFEKKQSYYSRLGRVMVCYDAKANSWHCPCVKAKMSCPHKYVAKWLLFQTRVATV